MRMLTKEVYENFYQYVLKHHGGDPKKLVEMIEQCFIMKKVEIVKK